VFYKHSVQFPFIKSSDFIFHFHKSVLQKNLA